MLGDVRSGRGVTGGTGCGSRRRVGGLAGGRVRAECSSARLGYAYSPPRPGTTSLDGFAGPIVVRVFGLEE